jgi:hypothetical protein
MRHTIVEGPNKGKRINIPDEFIQRSQKAYDLDLNGAIQMYLDDEGYMENVVVHELTVKAKEAGTTAKNTADKPKRKPPVRKPDELKRTMIASLAEYLGTVDKMGAIEVTNIERMIAFEFAGDKYELTLTKKRKPKE